MTEIKSRRPEKQLRSEVGLGVAASVGARSVDWGGALDSAKRQNCRRAIAQALTTSSRYCAYWLCLPDWKINSETPDAEAMYDPEQRT